MKDKIKLPDAVWEFFVAKGHEGGKARAAKLTKKQQSQIAKKAARARWQKEDKDGSKS